MTNDQKTGLRELGRLGPVLFLALGACGGGEDPTPTPTPNPMGEEQVPLMPPECDQSGHACTWLGRKGQEGFNGDGRHRLLTKMYWSMNMLFGSDGQIWFIDWNNHLVRVVLPDNTVKTVVGWTDPIFPGDGGAPGEKEPGGADGTAVQLNHPTDLAEQPDGTVLLMAWHNHKLRAIDPVTKRVRIVSGGGAGFKGDGGPAKGALYIQPSALELDSAGNIYVLAQQNNRIRKIDTSTSAIITTIAGNGEKGFTGDGGPATMASFRLEGGSNPEVQGGLAIAGDKLYLSDTLNHRVRVIDLRTGVINTLAGTGEEGYSGDGGPALQARFNTPRFLRIGPDGDLYVADTNNAAIRAIDLDTNMVRTVAGTGEHGLDEQEGKLATETKLRRPFGLNFDREGNLYISDTLNSRIVRVTK